MPKALKPYQFENLLYYIKTKKETGRSDRSIAQDLFVTYNTLLFWKLKARSLGLFTEEFESVTKEEKHKKCYRFFMKNKGKMTHQDMADTLSLSVSNFMYSVRIMRERENEKKLDN